MAMLQLDRRRPSPHMGGGGRPRSPSVGGGHPSPHTGGGDLPPDSMAKVSLADVDPLATCNDGTPGIYYWAPGAKGSRSLLFLLGYGGWCWDAKTCAARPADMVSSAPYP